MIKFTNFKDSLIRYKDIGHGKVIVLLHGYLESLETWNEFAEELTRDYRIISIDLPGHGQSGIYSEEHSMEFMADVVKFVLDDTRTEKCFLIGHSMGGYVTLAFLKFYSWYLSGFSLFHSTPFSDTPEKKLNREREIELVKAGKSQVIYNAHIPKTFAEPTNEKYKKEISKGIEIAKKTPPDGIIAALNGMKSRPDQSTYLEKTHLPFLYIQGMHDNFIPVEIISQIEFPENHKILKLENSGHMGFLEEKNICINAISGFISNI